MASRQRDLDALVHEDFLAFLRMAFATLAPGDVLAFGWHLEAIAFQLSAVARGDCRRLLVTMPPRSLKSITVSVAWVAFMLGRDPSLRFICASYSADLALKLARDCRKIMQSDWYRRVFPGVRLARSAEHDIETTLGGGRYSTSVGGTLTGRGGDYLIIDDPINPQEAASEAARRTAREWLTGTAMTRLNDKKSGAMIMIMQRLHQDDPAGLVLEAGGWTHLNLPAIAVEAGHIQIAANVFHWREIGDLLQPDREPLWVLEQQKREMGSARFEAQYQQSPMPPEGLMVKKAWLKTYPLPFIPQPGDSVVQSWDTAVKLGEGNDWSVCVTAVVRRRQVFILDVYRARLDFPQLRKAVEAMALRHKAKVLLIEDAASGAQLIQQLHHDQPRGVPLPIARKVDRDKVTRVAACTPTIEAGGLFLPPTAPWLDDFLGEVLGFPNARHDDQVDALAQLLNWEAERDYLPRLDPAAIGRNTGPSWTEQLNAGYGAGNTSCRQSSSRRCQCKCYTGLFAPRAVHRIIVFA